MNLLVRSPNWLGDQVLAYPFFYHLRKLYPQAAISVVCVSWVKDLQFRNLIDDVIEIPTQKSDSLVRRFWRLDQCAKEMAKKKWDLGIALPNSFSAAWLLYRAKCVRRRGYEGDARSFLLNEKKRWNPDPRRHRATAYLDLLTESEDPIDHFWKSHSFDAPKAWPQANPLDVPEGEYFLIGPGATADSRRWKARNFLDLARRIHQRFGWKAYVLGGRQEKEVAQLLSEESFIEDLSNQGPIVRLWKIFKKAKLTLCNESGLAHVASLCGSPVHIVCGAADPRRTQPIGPGPVRVTINPVECWPCEKNICLQTSDKINQCLEGIFPERVAEEIEARVEEAEIEAKPRS